MAVEDAPRSNPDLKEESVQREEAKPVRQSFLDRVRDLIRSDEHEDGKKKESEEDKDTGKDDTETESVPEKKRSKFFSGLRGLIIPKPDRIQPEIRNTEQVESRVADHEDVGQESSFTDAFYETWSPKAVEDVVGDRAAESGDTLAPVAETEEHPADSTEAESYSQFEMQPTNLESDSSDLEPTAHDNPVELGEEEIPLHTGYESPVTEVRSVAPVESVQTILQRQHQLGELPTESGAVFATSTEASPIFTRATPEAVEQRPDTTAALLAVDLIDHMASKRRDKKVEARSVERDEAIEKQQKKQQAEVNKQLVSQELYQKELQKRIERQEKQQLNRLPKIRNNDFRTTVQEADIQNREAKVNKTTNVVENNSVKNVDKVYRAPAVEYRTPEQNIVAAPDIALPTAETILQKVEAAAEKNVPIETQYELRHERKGNQDFVAAQDSSGPLNTNPVSDNSLAGWSASTPGPHSNMPSQSNDTGSKKDEYQQAAATGAVGAAVGILLFVIFYLITR